MNTNSIGSLVVARKDGESVLIKVSDGQEIMVKNLGRSGQSTRFLIQAPKSFRITKGGGDLVPKDNY